MTSKKGISAPRASAPSTAPRMSAPHINKMPPASSELKTGDAAVRPASRMAGAEKASPIKEYKSACAASPPVIAQNVPRLPNSNMMRMSAGRSTQLSALTPFVPRAAKGRTAKSPATESHGLIAGSSASSAAIIPAHGTKERAYMRNAAMFPPPEKKAASSPRRPPYFFPSERKNAQPAANTRQESAKAGR